MKRAARPNLGLRVLKGTGSAIMAAGAPAAARPVLSGSLLLFASLFGWVATNALYAQTGRHAHPLLTTRPDSPVAKADAASDAPMLPVPLVRDVQVSLAEAGYYGGDADGLPGKATTAAIRAFQTDHGLAIDGVATPRLLTAIAEQRNVSREETASVGRTERVASLEPKIQTADDATAAVPAPPVAAAPSRDLVRRVQEGLKAARIADLNADGLMGSRTEAAIRTFQASQGLDVTGVPDEALLKRLRSLVSAKR